MTAKNYAKSLNDKAEKALKVAVAKALRQHAAAGVPAVIWENGKVVALKPRAKK